jgi:hypothetical protein
MAACSFSQTKSYCCFSPGLLPTRCNYDAALHAATTVLHLVLLLRHCTSWCYCGTALRDTAVLPISPCQVPASTPTLYCNSYGHFGLRHCSLVPTFRMRPHSLLLRTACCHWCGPTASPSRCDLRRDGRRRRRLAAAVHVVAGESDNERVRAGGQTVHRPLRSPELGR